MFAINVKNEIHSWIRDLEVKEKMFSEEYLFFRGLSLEMNAYQWKRFSEESVAYQLSLDSVFLKKLVDYRIQSDVMFFFFA